MNVAKVFIGHVRVYLCRIDACMAQKSLHTANIRAVLQKIGGKTMANSVWRHLFGNAGFDGVFFNDALNRARGESS